MISLNEKRLLALQELSRIKEELVFNRAGMFDTDSIDILLWQYISSIDGDYENSKINIILKEAELPLIQFPDCENVPVDLDCIDMPIEEQQKAFSECMNYLEDVDIILKNYISEYSKIYKI